MPLTDITLPKIDQYAAKRVLANRIMNNVVQSQIWRDGLGITEAFSDNVMAAQVRIVRQNMPVQTSRTLGVGTGFNDSHFNTLDPEQPITSEYELPLIEMFDRNIDIADVLDDMIQVGTLNITMETLEKRLAQIVNAYTLAIKIAAALTFDADQGGGELIRFNPITDAFTQRIAEAHQKLDEGAINDGIDTFPQENRIVVTNTQGKYQLLTVEKSVFNVGASRAVELLEIGSAGKLQRMPETNVTGYYGEIYNTPLHMASNIIYRLAEHYLGLHEGALNGVMGVVSASQATARGIAFPDSVKIIDNPRGQGLRLQPKTRWGVNTLISEGERLIVREDFHNPLDGDEVDALTVTGPDNIDPTDVPDNSIYHFVDKTWNYNYFVDADLDGAGTVVPSQLGLTKEGENGYSNVRIDVEVVEKPGDGSIQIFYDGTTGVDIVDEGYLGLADGQPIDEKGAPYTTPIDLTVRADRAGTYRVKMELVDKGNSDEVLATKIFTIYVQE